MYTSKITLVILQQAPSWLVKYMTKGNAHQIGILDNLLKYRQPHQCIHMKKKRTSIIVN